MRTRKRYEVTVEEKQCFCCKKVKVAKDFPKNCQLIGGLHTWCKECSNTKNKEKEYYKTSREVKKEKMKSNPEFKEYVLTQKNDNRKKNITTSLLNSCRKRAEKNSLDFDLVKEDIVIPERCPVLGQPLICGNKEDYSFSPSVDRIDNSKGYVKGNIQVISMKANKMKNNGSIEELIAFADWVNKTFK